MIKTYANRAEHDAASKSQMESTVALIENINETVIDGVNVITSQPKVGDIVIYDENRDIKYISLDTYQGGVFPTAWEVLGVVVLRKGNKVTVCSKENAAKKQMAVYPYIVTDMQLDNEVHTAQLRLHKMPSTSTYYDFTYTAADVDGFVDALKQFLSDKGEKDWSAYKDDEGRVILQYDNYTSTEYYSTGITHATGLTLTAKVTVDYPEAQPSFWRKCGNRGYGIWHAARAKVSFKNDQTNTAFNPSSDVSSVPTYPICWPAFAGTSEHQSDHCLWLRQQYCKDPSNPTVEEWEAYIDDITHRIPYMLAGHAPKWRSGKVLSDMVKDITYQTADGSKEKLYIGVDYCSQFIVGKGYLPSMTELIEAFEDVTYGLSGVTRDKADPINRSLYAIGGSAVSCTTSWWVSGRHSSYSSWVAGSYGYLGNNNLFNANRCVAFALLELPEGND